MNQFHFKCAVILESWNSCETAFFIISVVWRKLLQCIGHSVFCFFNFLIFFYPKSKSNWCRRNQQTDLIPRVESASSIHFLGRLNQSWLHEKQELKTNQSLSNSLFDFIQEKILSSFCIFCPRVHKNPINFVK